MLTASRVRDVLKYDPDTGRFAWRATRGGRSGDAGYINCWGYRVIMIDGRNYRGNRLAWLYTHGETPAGEIDHINMVRDDDRIANLRLATRTLNNANRRRYRNNASGFKGVVQVGKRWRAEIRLNRQSKHLGYFDTAEEAHAAYVTAAHRTFGEFARAA